MQQPKFNIGDLVTYAAPELPYQKKRGIGEVVRETDTHYFIKWEDFPRMECPHGKEIHYFAHGMLVKVGVAGHGKNPKHIQPTLPIKDCPEIPTDLHGYFEHYQPVIKGAKPYWYRRYVYADISGKLRHHHVPNKMVESIETLWRSGATAKEICLALGKNFSH